MQPREAYIILNYLPAVGPVRVAELLTFFETPAAILAASRRELTRIRGIGEKVADTIVNWQKLCDLQAELDLTQQAGVQLVTPLDDAYPPLLREIHDPPLALYLRGDPEALRQTQAAIAIVGSRHTTAYGVHMAEELAGAAALAGWTVVSGLARGIDTVAHEAVVRLGGRTVAVIGSGLGRLYPQENIELARRIAEKGAVISEFPMNYAPNKHTFPMRNRIISGMTRGTLVVEAGTKSGSLITAGQAADQNRLVFAVPGRADSPQSRGCHGLIKEGAKLVETFQDVLEEFNVLPGFERITLPAATPASGEEADAGDGETATPAGPGLNDLERRIFDSLEGGERTIDDVVVASQGSGPDVLRALFNLEMRRLVRQLPGKRVMRVSGAAVAG